MSGRKNALPSRVHRQFLAQRGRPPHRHLSPTTTKEKEIVLLKGEKSFTCRATLIMSPCGDIRNVPFWRGYDNRNVP